MKKILFLLFISIFILVGCNNENNQKQDETDKEVETNEEDVNSKEKPKNKTEQVSDSEQEQEDNENELTEDELKQQEKEAYINEILEEYDGLKNFIDDFNELASSSDKVNEIDKSNLEENGLGFTLYTSPEYEILEYYDELQEYHEFRILISQSQPYKELQGEGFEAMLLIAEALNYDKNTLIETFEDSFSKSRTTTANEDGRSIVIVNQEENEDLADWGIEVNFTNQ